MELAKRKSRWGPNPTTPCCQHFYLPETSSRPIFRWRDPYCKNLTLSLLTFLACSILWCLTLMFGIVLSSLHSLLVNSHHLWVSSQTFLELHYQHLVLSVLVTCPTSDCWFPQIPAFLDGAWPQIYRLLFLTIFTLAVLLS